MSNQVLTYLSGQPVVTPPLYRRGDTWGIDFSTPWDTPICLSDDNHIGFRSCDTLKLYSPSANKVMLEAATGSSTEYVSLKASGVGGTDFSNELRIAPNVSAFYYGGALQISFTNDVITFENGAVDTGINFGTSAQLGLTVGGNILFKVTDTILTFGRGAAGVDYRLTVDGETNDGTIDWMEDEDYFRFNDDLFIANTEKLYIGTTSHYFEDVAAAGVFLNINAASGINFSFGGTGAFLFSATAITPSVDLAVSLGSTSARMANIYAGTSIQLRAGTSTSYAKMGGDIAIDLTQTGNVGTGVDTLQTYSVAANVLSTNEMHLEAEWFGTFTASAATKQIIASYASTTLLDTGAMAITGAGSWRMHSKIFRTGATTQIAITTFWCSDATIKEIVTFSTPGGTLSGATTLLLTGTATNNDDIVKRGFQLRWGPDA